MTGPESPEGARTQPNERLGRVEIGPTIRAAAAAIRGLPLAVALVVLGFMLVEDILPAGVLTVIGPLLQAGATVFVVTALLRTEPRGLGQLVDLSLRRLPAAVGVALVQIGVLFVEFLAIGLVLFVAGERPSAESFGAPLIVIALAMGGLVAPLAARWMCALPFVVDRSLGPIGAVKASWRRTRGSWIACFVLVLPTTLVTWVPAFVDGPLRLPVGLVTDAATIIVAGAIAVAAYRQVAIAAVMEPNRLGDEAPPNVRGPGRKPAAEGPPAAAVAGAMATAPNLIPKSRLTLLNVSLALAGVLWIADHSSALSAGSSGAWAPLGELAFEFILLAGIFYVVGWVIRSLYHLGQPPPESPKAGPPPGGEWH
jgi:hypothetical protein